MGHASTGIGGEKLISSKHWLSNGTVYIAETRETTYKTIAILNASVDCCSC